MIVRNSPEANIRIDLLVIVPLVLLRPMELSSCLDSLVWAWSF